MSEKRKRDAGDASGDRERSKKKAKRGFVVGPDNLPEGAYKRKTQKIKQQLIERAQIKKNYAKLKRQGKIPSDPVRILKPTSPEVEPENEDASPDIPQADSIPHPDRQALIDDPDPPPLQQPPTSEQRPRTRKPKPQPFQKDYEAAQKRKAEAEERRQARVIAEQQRQEKIFERERFRKAMAKARTGGQNGQRKLGRESKVLLERVRRMVGEGK